MAKFSNKSPTMEQLLAAAASETIGLKRGSKVSGTVVYSQPSEIAVDFGGKSEGIVASKELEFFKTFGLPAVGDEIEAIVLIPEDDQGRTILSLRSTYGNRRWQKLAELAQSGETVEVKVWEVVKSGVLVDSGGVQGFIPATLLATEFVTNPQSLVGKNLQATVLESDQQSNRLIFSQKLPTIPAQFEKKLKKFAIAKKYRGKITAILPFGILVDLDGVPGIVHTSEISWEKVGNFESASAVGDEIEVKVIGCDLTFGRLNLSVKQLISDPWEKISQKYPADSQVSGKVLKLTNFGVFVQLEPGIEGLLHISKIPPGCNLAVSDQVECLVESIDEDSRRLSLNLVLKQKPVGYR